LPCGFTIHFSPSTNLFESKALFRHGVKDNQAAVNHNPVAALARFQPPVRVFPPSKIESR
jgi:hypothetical protein